MGKGSVRLFCFQLVLCLTVNWLEAVSSYSVAILSKSPPGLSIANPKGSGYSPCKYTFNPAWVPPLPNQDPNKALVIVRSALCPDNFGGTDDHLMMAYCYLDDGHCDDLLPAVLDLEKTAEDPRIVFYEGWYYLFYYASGSGLKTVYLRKTQTPTNPTSWVYLASFPWHRNGCLLLRSTPPHYCIYGEAPPLKALGMATTTNLVDYISINDTFLVANGDGGKEPEIVVEASTPVVKLSTGDYFHIYSAGTPGWVPNGNYTGGWIILDANNPNIIKQRSTEHLFVPTEPWEIGNGDYPVQRYRTIFATAIVPTGKAVDQFRVWYGATDANVASAIIQVTH